jgi:hypothetical protein
VSHLIGENTGIWPRDQLSDRVARARKLADAGMNIELAYTTLGGGVRLVLGVYGFEKARAAV